MGARGPAPKPTHLKVLEGNPGRRPLNKNEPKPKPVAPKCPAWLDKEAKHEWKRVAPELEKLGLLTIVDGTALAAYCQAYSRWVAAEKVLTTEGMTYETETGYIRQRPEVGIVQKYLNLIKLYCAEFGLTPSARSRMTLPGEDKDDDDGILDW
ncbi:Phage terminase, small subunit [Sporotomaculum syntrophicum]|uniref:Phage terminase, small subunit n=1 Tax=Sporotomaculum syntrophicum TaxID=182264 RepID=A0A9D2WP41_9FIRM|nr:phage terminase small subunit P27 family [Sporotomaculum syntrophicum]KAF1084849.1 Phage terminase, small subunit [Sporotomaculum syntrophicum]